MIGDGGSKDSWESVWQHGMTPWDTGKAAPPLVALLKDGTVRGSRILVPGCGSGLDAFAAATVFPPGCEAEARLVIGQDVSQTAVEMCRKRQTEMGVSETALRFEQADFFAGEVDPKFDCVFDYT